MLQAKEAFLLFTFFSSAKFSKVVVSGPNHLLSSIAEVLNALILLSEPLGDHTWIVVLKTVGKNAIQSPPWVQV